MYKRQVRGIQEGNGTPPDGDLWVTYSVNKEDMWVSHIPVPVRAHASAHADDNFANYKDLNELTDWNLYSLCKGINGSLRSASSTNCIR